MLMTDQRHIRAFVRAWVSTWEDEGARRIAQFVPIFSAAVTYALALMATWKYFCAFSLANQRSATYVCDVTVTSRTSLCQLGRAFVFAAM